MSDFSDTPTPRTDDIARSGRRTASPAAAAYTHARREPPSVARRVSRPALRWLIGTALVALIPTHGIADPCLDRIRAAGTQPPAVAIASLDAAVAEDRCPVLADLLRFRALEIARDMRDDPCAIARRAAAFAASPTPEHDLRAIASQWAADHRRACDAATRTAPAPDAAPPDAAPPRPSRTHRPSDPEPRLRAALAACDCAAAARLSAAWDAAEPMSAELRALYTDRCRVLGQGCLQGD